MVGPTNPTGVLYAQLLKKSLFKIIFLMEEVRISPSTKTFSSN